MTHRDVRPDYLRAASGLLRGGADSPKARESAPFSGIRTEYDLPVDFQPTSLFTVRWLEADDERELKRFLDAHQGVIADDWSGAPVFLAGNAYRMKVAEEDWKQIRFRKTREHAE